MRFQEESYSIRGTIKTLFSVRVLRLWSAEIGKKTAALVPWLYVVLLFSFAQTSQLFAQDPNNNYCENPQGAEKGGFILNKTRICVGGAVTIVAGSVPANLGATGYVSQYSGKGI